MRAYVARPEVYGLMGCAVFCGQASAWQVSDGTAIHGQELDTLYKVGSLIRF